MLNILPFSAGDIDSAREKVFGQNIESLASVVDMFEVMTYHQILRRPICWIPPAGEEVKRRSGLKTLCTIQSKPIYLDGIGVFVWSDLLKEVTLDQDYRRVDMIRARWG